MPNVSPQPEPSSVVELSAAAFSALSLPEKYQALLVASRMGSLHDCLWWRDMCEQDRTQLMEYNASLQSQLRQRQHFSGSATLSSEELEASRSVQAKTKPVNLVSDFDCRAGGNLVDTRCQDVSRRANVSFASQFRQLFDVYGGDRHLLSISEQLVIHRQSIRWLRFEIAKMALQQRPASGAASAFPVDRKRKLDHALSNDGHTAMGHERSQLCELEMPSVFHIGANDVERHFPTEIAFYKEIVRFKKVNSQRQRSAASCNDELTSTVQREASQGGATPLQYSKGNVSFMSAVAAFKSEDPPEDGEGGALLRNYAARRLWRLTDLHERTCTMSTSEYLHFASMRRAASFTRTGSKKVQQAAIKRFSQWVCPDSNVFKAAGAIGEYTAGDASNMTSAVRDGASESSDRRTACSLSRESPFDTEFAPKIVFTTTAVKMLDFVLCDKVAHLVEIKRAAKTKKSNIGTTAPMKNSPRSPGRT